MDEITELKHNYNKHLDRLNKGFDYVEKHPEEYDKWESEIIKISRILGALKRLLNDNGVTFDIMAGFEGIELNDRLR
jgi:uncharacterized protein YukE